MTTQNAWVSVHGYFRPYTPFSDGVSEDLSEAVMLEDPVSDLSSEKN